MGDVGVLDCECPMHLQSKRRGEKGQRAAVKRVQSPQPMQRAVSVLQSTCAAVNISKQTP
eukprot:1142811-Pelagomonas_calceolata.AAC.4